MATAAEILNATRDDPGQNSLLTIEAADELAVFDLSGDWETLEADEKAKYLVHATRMIKDPLLFPGLDLTDDAAYAAAQTACFYQAMFLVRNLDDIRDAENAMAMGAKAISSPVGSVAVTRYSRANSRSKEAETALAGHCYFGPPRLLR
jgi:hypothetical protein